MEVIQENTMLCKADNPRESNMEKIIGDVEKDREQGKIKSMTSQLMQTNQTPLTIVEKSMINTQSELKKLCSEKL